MKLERSQQMIYQYDLEKIISKEHYLRKVQMVVDFGKISRKYLELRTTVGRQGYGLEVGIKCLFLQFSYDLSDRGLEDRLRHDMAFRWFCGISLDGQTPDHTFFTRIRKTLGTKRIGQVFKNIMQKAEEKRIVSNVFTFVDASAIKVKETTWDQRDKAISEGEEKLNNSNVSKYSADKDARFGCKGKNKFWYGHKKHVGVDMKSGMIKKIAVTPANVTDQEGLKHVCPKEGMVFADKSYCVKKAQEKLKANGCHSGAILKNNMKAKNKDKDRWITKVRAPFEGTFSKMNRRAKYRGVAKVQMQVFLEAIVFNVKRLIAINAPPLFVGA